MGDLKNKVESVLFAAGNWMTVEEVAKICRKTEGEILSMLLKLKKDYQDNTTLTIREDDGRWKLTIRDQYLPLARKIVKRMELPKSVMETLAVVAYKVPVMQSEIIHIRNNKAYDHLSNLEKQGFITRERKGRSKLIKLGKKFFDYFDVPPDKVKEFFAPVAELEREVVSMEERARLLKKAFEEKTAEIKRKERETKESQEQQRIVVEKELKEMPKIEIGGAPVAIYEDVVEKVEEPMNIEDTNLKVDKEMMGDLEVVDQEVVKEGGKVVHWGQFDVVDVKSEKKEVPEEEELATEEPQTAESLAEEILGEEGESKEGKGLYSEGMPDHVKSRVDQRVKELLGEPIEEEEEKKEE